MLSSLPALAVFVIAFALLGALLGWLSSSSGALRFRLPGSQQDKTDGESSDAPSSAPEEPDEQPAEQLIERVNACLPQTQCAQCGHPGCRPYATAIIVDDAPINQCPPGGEALIHELADLLGKEFMPLDAECGETKPPQVALIDEPLCIGCTLCIAACPVDAIVGASRLMHTVVSDQCTGCELCLPPCPVDCISLVPADTSLAQWRWPKPA